MCLIAFSWNPGSDQPLLLLANRDEFYARPSAPAEWWSDPSGIWAGRDLQAGGTWLGLTCGGRFAALTNFRNGVPQNNGAASRGELAVGFLQDAMSPCDYARQVTERASRYNGFNLIVGEIYGAAGRAPSVWYCGNQEGGTARELPAGVYGLSNAALDTPWPKLTRLKARLAGVDDNDAGLVDACLAFLSDPTPADESELPDTGISAEWERLLSPVFIVGAGYGTRAQTVVRADACGNLEAHERSFDGVEQARALQPAAVRRLRVRVRTTT
ncbi:MAG: NRDE family protein [Pigmentiphaga sp.]